MEVFVFGAVVSCKIEVKIGASFAKENNAVVQRMRVTHLIIDVRPLTR
jgi:hypothetical protein